MFEPPELLAINRSLDELTRRARQFTEDVARLRADIALLGQLEHRWTDDEGLGGFASTLGRPA
jgi:hypothetical protein